MPMYEINCTCGGTEGMSTISEREDNNKLVPCFDCGELAPSATVNKLPVHGQTWPGGKHFAQLGRSFESAGEMERWAASNGYEPVSNESRRWKTLKDDSKQANDDEAKSQGFSHADDRRKTLKTQSAGVLEANRAHASKVADAAPSPEPLRKNITLA